MMWIEMFQTGDHGGAGWGFGECLWAPSPPPGGRKFAYAESLLRVKKHDIVLHLKGANHQQAFTGYSTAADDGQETKSRPPNPGKWGYTSGFYRVPLIGYTAFAKPFRLEDILARQSTPLRAYLQTRRRKELLFFAERAGHLKCGNGWYLTELSEELGSILFGADFGWAANISRASKAIVTASYAQESTDAGLPTAADLGGDDTTVRSAHSEVKIEVDVRRSPATWTFRANPERYKVRDAVKHLEIDVWTVGQSEVMVGDRVLIWQTLDSEGHRGVIAIGDVLANPELRTDLENPYWRVPEDGQELERRVPVRYLPTSGLPLWLDDPRHSAVLGELSVAKARRGTVFKVTPDQWERLARLVSCITPSTEEVTASEQLRYRSSGKGGQGFGLSAAERRIVEEHAMQAATRYFERDWETVKDVSRDASFDLYCRRGAEELRVEVKGTTGIGEEIILTKNEVREAKEVGYALFVMSEIGLIHKKTESVSASGGICRLFFPWFPEAESLTPIAYSCQLDRAGGQICHRCSEEVTGGTMP
jgi:hypothetical protein